MTWGDDVTAEDVANAKENIANSNNSTNDGAADDDDAYNNKTHQYRPMDIHEYVFTAFRFGLFAFIICFPCIRAIRIWFSAGGRIRFRRTGGIDADGNPDENRGWIIGLRYQPADLDRWLILSGYNQRHFTNNNQAANGSGGSAANAHKLTPEEVYALPEIEAPAPKAPTNEDMDDGDIAGDIELGTVDELAVTYYGMKGNTSTNDNSNNDTNPSNPNIETIEPESDATAITTNESTSTTTTATTTTSLFKTTMSTSCSICIEDFEEGEKIRLLPRCGHAFHTDCIIPWLTERQGCCPYCKAGVICPPTAPGEEEDGNGDNNNDNNSNNHNGDPITVPNEDEARTPTSSTSTIANDRFLHSAYNHHRQYTPGFRW